MTEVLLFLAFVGASLGMRLPDRRYQDCYLVALRDSGPSTINLQNDLSYKAENEMKNYQIFDRPSGGGWA